MVAGQVYDSYYVWAIAACRAGGSGVPYDGIEQNKKVCQIMRDSIYRGVVGTIKFMWGPGSAALSGGDARSLARHADHHDAVSGLDQGRGLRRAGSLRHGRLDDPAVAHQLGSIAPEA